MTSKMRFLGLGMLSAALVLSFTSCDDKEENAKGYEHQIKGLYEGTLTPDEGLIVLDDLLLTIEPKSSAHTDRANLSTEIDLSVFGLPLPDLNVTCELVVEAAGKGYKVTGENIVFIDIEASPDPVPVTVILTGTIVEGVATIQISATVPNTPTLHFTYLGEKYEGLTD
jgi:hypothetical protein